MVRRTIRKLRGGRYSIRFTWNGGESSAIIIGDRMAANRAADRMQQDVERETGLRVATGRKKGAAACTCKMGLCLRHGLDKQLLR